MDENFLHNNSNLQLSSSTLDGNFGYGPHLAENTLFQQYAIKAEEYDSHLVPQWIGYQQTTPDYVEYLAGISGIQGEIPCDNTSNGCCFIPEESFLSIGANRVIHSWPQHEEVPPTNFITTQHETCYQKQGPDEGLDNAAQHLPNMSVSTKGTTSRERLRQKATDADRRRRTRIAAALDALDELLPQSKEELSQNRLGGEPTSNHLTFLEGYGHYLVHQNTACGPLQDMLGKLLEVNPSAATKLLESRGLFMMPIAPN